MDNNAIYRHTRDFIGGNATVNAYHNKSNTKQIEIMTSTDTMYKQVDIHSTIGLSNTELGLCTDGRSLRVELISVGDKGDEITAKIMASIALEVMDKGLQSCYYGRIYSGIIHQYDNTHDMKHVILLAPNGYWDKYRLLEFEHENIVVVWLLLVPISDAEKAFIDTNGVPAFEELLSRQTTDVTDRKRKSFL